MNPLAIAVTAVTIALLCHSNNKNKYIFFKSSQIFYNKMFKNHLLSLPLLLCEYFYVVQTEMHLPNCVALELNPSLE